MRDDFLTWGRAPHNPHEGKNRPAFSWPAFYRYARGEVDADGQPIRCVERPPGGWPKVQSPAAVNRVGKVSTQA